MQLQLQYNARWPLLTPVVLTVIFIVNKIWNTLFVIYVLINVVFVMLSVIDTVCCSARTRPHILITLDRRRQITMWIYNKYKQYKLNILHPNHMWWIILNSVRKNTGLFKMIVGVLTTCHTQYTWDSSICIFLFNRTTLQVFVTFLTGALYVHPLWFYKHQHENRVHFKLFVACQRFAIRRHLSKLCPKRRNT
jgi:hypothetical protein